jgi:short-subunit dehydrogenase
VTTVIIGASAGVGRALGRALAAQGHQLFLVARGAEDLDAEARHLGTVYGAEVAWVAADAAKPAALVEALRGLADAPIRHLLFPLGLTEENDDGSLDAEAIRRLVDVNLTSVMAVTALLLPRLLEANAGTIVGFGSIAAIRGRGANIAYAAAKRGLESYFESLRHRLAPTGVAVQFYRLGYVASQMSFGKKLPFPAIAPEHVAEQVVRHLGRDHGLRHLPWYWAGIAVALNVLPWPVYKRLKF